MKINIRKPREDDFGGIFSCLAFYNLHVLGQNPRADENFAGDAIISVRNTICHVDISDKCWVSEGDDQILGFCCWDWIQEDAGRAKTVLISTVPQARSLGVGKLLQKKRLDEMRAQNAREVHTWSDDPAAIAWYRKIFGYELIGYEPIRHSLHRFHFGGGPSTWTIHRGFVEQSQLAHLKLQMNYASRQSGNAEVCGTAPMGQLDPIESA